MPSRILQSRHSKVSIQRRSHHSTPRLSPDRRLLILELLGTSLTANRHLSELSQALILFATSARNSVTLPLSLVMPMLSYISAPIVLHLNAGLLSAPQRMMQSSVPMRAAITTWCLCAMCLSSIAPVTIPSWPPCWQVQQ